jgi:hypothetical protein
VFQPKIVFLCWQLSRSYIQVRLADNERAW